VKNRAKDGRHYWVFAIVTPVEGGYLSVRLKPSGPLFKAVEKEYQTLVEVERRRQIKPAESAELLLKRLAELGFPNYTAFMAKALGQEFAARNAELGRPLDPTIGHFDALAEAAQILTTQANLTFEAYAVNAYVPLNLRVQAAQLGDIAATIGVISSNYNIISEEIRAMLNEFMALAAQVFEAVNGGLFMVCTAKIQREIAELFRSEAQTQGIGRDEEARLLDGQNRAYQRIAVDSLHALSRQAERFHQSCTDMKRLAAGLEVTRVMGKIESARLDTTAEGLNDLIDSLEDFQTAISESLKEIDRMNRTIYRNIQELLVYAEAAA
jgi:aerotaxis receptor